MYKAFKYRIYPNKEQQVLLVKHFGHCRFLWNLALETKIYAYSSSKVNYNRYELQSQLVDLKNEFDWLKEVNSQSLQSVLMNLDKAYKRFFKGAGFPKFKSKHGSQSFHVPQKVKVQNGRLFIPKFNRTGIKINLHRSLNGIIKSATISKTPTGIFYVSILCNVNQEIKNKCEVDENTSIGVDLGVKDFAVTSEGTVIENPRFLKNSLDRLKVLQRRAENKKRNGSNRKKAFLKVAILHQKIKNQRLDFLHKVSTQLIRDNQTICLETLNVKGMVKNHNLAQSISDSSWSEFNRMLEYKSDWYGVNILRINQFAPSSKTCVCGFINNDLKLSERIWNCINCGETNYRDLLAANNIKKFALEDYQGRCCP
ncbi:transposase [Aegicerativicinus sediminis]|uniref:transposase n=1 Tax=Aegicerativicinus sediminis TaxID=2893202 RepID=UPI001E440466|nr:transposase [Aegicerativicinus sediminis]